MYHYSRTAFLSHQSSEKFHQSLFAPATATHCELASHVSLRAVVGRPRKVLTPLFFSTVQCLLSNRDASNPKQGKHRPWLESRRQMGGGGNRLCPEKGTIGRAGERLRGKKYYKKERSYNQKKRIKYTYLNTYKSLLIYSLDKNEPL